LDFKLALARTKKLAKRSGDSPRLPRMGGPLCIENGFDLLFFVVSTA
jgi:hypothetical protein